MGEEQRERDGEGVARDNDGQPRSEKVSPHFCSLPFVCQWVATIPFSSLLPPARAGFDENKK